MVCFVETSTSRTPASPSLALSTQNTSGALKPTAARLSRTTVAPAEQENFSTRQISALGTPAAGSTPRQNLDVGASHEVSPTRASAHIPLVDGCQPVTTVTQLLRDVFRHIKHGEFLQGIRCHYTETLSNVWGIPSSP